MKKMKKEIMLTIEIKICQAWWMKKEEKNVWKIWKNYIFIKENINQIFTNIDVLNYLINRVDELGNNCISMKFF